MAGVDSIGFPMRFLAGHCLVGGASTALKLAKSRGAAGLMIVATFAFTGTKLAGQFTDAGGVAAGLAQTVGPVAATPVGRAT